MDKERVIAIFLMPIAVGLWQLLVEYLERRRDRKEAALADYHSRSVVVSAPLRLGCDRGSSEDCSARGATGQGSQQ